MANIKLPDNLVPTRFPGYYWDVANKILYSIKVNGELTPLKLQKGGYHLYGFNEPIPPHYRVSYKGLRKMYTLEYLNGLTKLKYDVTIEVQ